MQASGQLTVQERYAMIAALPRPRPLRRSPIASFLAVLIVTLLKLAALVLFGNLLWSLRTFTSLSAFPHEHKGNLGGLFFVCLALLVVTLAQWKQKSLVANGEVAVATVMGRSYMNPYWYVNYEFQDKSGKTNNNRAMDKTGKKFLVAGQQMFVYYRADNPGNIVAQSESWYEPAVSGMDPDPRF